MQNIESLSKRCKKYGCNPKSIIAKYVLDYYEARGWQGVEREVNRNIYNLPKNHNKTKVGYDTLKEDE